MKSRPVALALLAALALAGAARGAEVQPLAGTPVTLGPVSGTAFYTAGEGGFRVVATLAQGVDGVPVRVVATLAPGQAVTLSVPGKAGEEPTAVELARDGDRLLVRRGGPAS